MRAKGVFVRIMVVVVLLGGLACGTTQPVSEVPANTEASLASRCERFCRHLQTLGCEPFASDDACQTACINIETAGHNLNIACATQIQSCEALSSCRQ